MSIMRFNFRSQAIGRYVDVSIALPTDRLSAYDFKKETPSYRPLRIKDYPLYEPGMKFQTVYLIHGGGDDDSLTYRYTNAERYAQDNYVMLVTPNIANSFGADAVYGTAWQTFLSDELPKVVQSLFPSSPKREDNFLMGYAMGGNVALGTAIMHPEKYAAVVDISGGIGFTVRTEQMIEELSGDHFRNQFSLFRYTFGEPEDFAGSKNDIGAIAKKHLEEGVQLPEITMVCGEQEYIRKRVDADVAAMKEMGIDVNYIIPEGYDHHFPIWDEYVKVGLNELLPLKRYPIYPEK